MKKAAVSLCALLAATWLAASPSAATADDTRVQQLPSGVSISAGTADLISAMTPLMDGLMTGAGSLSVPVAGEGVSAAISQAGFHNRASIRQNGDISAAAAISQIGAYNRARVVQTRR